MSQNQRSNQKHPKGFNPSIPMNLQKVSNVSNLTLSKNVQRSALNSLTKLMPGSRHDVGGSTSTTTKTSKKRGRAKPYEPIRLPEDILTIQAHTASTPVTELPYLLIAAHIGALPTARQFYPPTSATHSPLTVFRDMFVMTIDVRGYKPSSVRLSTEGRLIIIECLQSEVPQVVFTQTGTVDANNKYVMDPPPKVDELPVHTSFNYVQHRVKLPDEFSEEGLKVGMDDVSGHVIITGRLVHNQKAAFPEPWNQSKVVKKPKGPLVNTSSVNLSKEDARKLAAWNAVQGSPQGKMEEIGSTNFMAIGKKQWLEKEGAKLRAIQHRALKENIRKLTEIKKGNASPPQQSTTVSESAQSSVKTFQEKVPNNESKINQKPRSNSVAEIPGAADVQLDVTFDTEPKVRDVVSEVTAVSLATKTLEGKVSNRLASAGKSEHGPKSAAAKQKESRPKVSFQQEVKSSQSPISNKKSQVRTDGGQKKRQPQKINQKNLRRKSKLEERKKAAKSKVDGYTANDSNETHDTESKTAELRIASRKSSNLSPASNPGIEVSKDSKSRLSLDPILTNPDEEVDTKNRLEASITDTVAPSAPSVPTPSVPRESETLPVDLGKPETLENNDSFTGPSNTETQTATENTANVKIAARIKSKSRDISKTSVKRLDISQAPLPREVKEAVPRSRHNVELDEGDDPVGKQDKAMWEKLLNFAVRRRSKPKSRSPSPDPKS